MSDMSFNQAKQLIERMEFSEIALRNSCENFNKSADNFEKTLKQQENMLDKLPKANKKIAYMQIALALNIGLIFGLLIGKYFL